MILASFYLTSIIPIWNIFLLSLFIACLIAISLIPAISSSTCVHSRSYNPIWLPQVHSHHHHNHRHADSNTHIHGREFEYGATYPHIHTR